MRKIFIFLVFMILFLPLGAIRATDPSMVVNINLSSNPPLTLNQPVTIDVNADWATDVSGIQYYKTYLYIKPQICFENSATTEVNCANPDFEMAVKESEAYQTFLSHQWTPNILLPFHLTAIARAVPSGSQDYGDILGRKDITIEITQSSAGDENGDEDKNGGGGGTIGNPNLNPRQLATDLKKLFLGSSEKIKEIEDIPSAIAYALLGLVGVIFFVMLIYGGVQYMTAGGNPDQETKAKKTLIYAMIGIIVIAGAWALVFGYIQPAFPK
jgi:hypothetical protein